MHKSKESSGYEYEIIGYCKRTGRPIVAPKSWSVRHPDRPWYYTCTCCGRK